MNKVSFQGKKEIVVDDGKTLLEAALENDIEMDHSCGGNGTCTTCRVKVLSSKENLPERNDLEKEMAEDRGFEDDERLGCQLEVYDGLVVEIGNLN